MKYHFLIIILVIFFSVQLNAQERRIQEKGKTYLVHVVEKGETIFSLSKTYSIEKKDLLNANPDLIFGLKTGQELKIPVDEPVEVQQEKPSEPELKPSFHTYRVKRKDALHFIAKRYGVEVNDILKYNPEIKGSLKRGQILLIPDAGDLKRIAELQKQIVTEKTAAKPKSHRVVGDETLYSLSKKYNCSISSILKANPEVGNGLRIGMEIIIPDEKVALEALPEQKDGFFVHLVESGETFWALERKYKVTRDVLEKYNPVLENGLLAGLQIKIPVSSALPNIEVAPVDEQAFDKHVVAKGETLFGLSNEYQLKISEIKKINPVLTYRGLMAGETILIPKSPEALDEASESIETKADHTIRIIERERPENCQPDDQAASGKYDVALLLPLYLLANDTVNRVPVTKAEMLLDSVFMSQVEDPEELPDDTFKIREDEIIYPRSENFVHFYEGVLLAVDSLQRAGMNVELHVFDTNQEQAVVDSLVQLDVFREMDLIIGPIFPNLQEPVGNFAYKNRIPMVSPLSSSGNFEEKNPWYFKVNPTKDYLVRETADFIGEEYFNQNLIVLQMGEYKHLPEAILVDLCREKFFSTGYHDLDREVRFHEYDFLAEGYWGLTRILSKDKQNVFIIPSETEAEVSVAVSNINSLAEDYPVTLVGLSNFQHYRSIQSEYYHHVNLQLLSPYFVDYHSALTNRFIGQFRDDFAAEPNQFSFQGYDVGFYFMSALFQYGKDFIDCLPSHHVQLNQAEFYFDRVSRYGGYLNRGLFVVNYKKNYDVTVNGVRGIPSLLLSE